MLIKKRLDTKTQSICDLKQKISGYILNRFKSKYLKEEVHLYCFVIDASLGVMNGNLSNQYNAYHVYVSKIMGTKEAPSELCE